MKQVIAFALISLIWYASACLAQAGVSTLIASDTQSFAYKLNAFGGTTRRSFDGQPIAQTAGQAASDAEAEKELTRIAQELVDAVARGDKAVWEKHLADDVIFTDENWTALTKKDLVDSLAPFPGYSGSIKVTKVRSRINGDAAVLSWEGLEEQYVYGQKLTPVYLITDTYFKRNGRWQLVAEHVAVRPQPRKAIQMSPARYNSFIGEYELTSGITYVITVTDGKLMAQRTGRNREEWLPADEDSFFRKGSIRGEKVFVRDAAGRVTAMLDRRENSDLTWKKIK